MDSSEEDTVLVNMLLGKENIEQFFDSIFGCLARFTDFYHIIESPEDKIGYPPGKIEEIVLQSLQKFSVNDLVPGFIQDTEVAEEITLPNIENLKIEEDFEPSDYHNGAKFETYCWSQTLSDTQLHIKLPKDISSAKQLDINLKSDFLEIHEKENPTNVILKGDLSNKCRYKDFVWSLESNNQLQINIDKVSETWWKKLFVTESDIDVQKIDSSVFVDDLNEAERAIVEKYQYSQQQEQLAEELGPNQIQAEVLKRAWNAEGSPFRGQDFDPSSVKFN